jgi:hypothetical protein
MRRKRDQKGQISGEYRVSAGIQIIETPEFSLLVVTQGAEGGRVVDVWKWAGVR